MIPDPHLDRLERKLALLHWTMIVSEIVYLVVLGLILRHFLK
jgi:hypothetical protein